MFCLVFGGAASRNFATWFLMTRSAAKALSRLPGDKCSRLLPSHCLACPGDAARRSAPACENRFLGRVHRLRAQGVLLSNHSILLMPLRPPPIPRSARCATVPSGRLHTRASGKAGRNPVQAERSFIGRRTRWQRQRSCARRSSKSLSATT